MDKLRFFIEKKEAFSSGYGAVTNESREGEDRYRKRYQYDKVIRSTHGVNCTGSCSWKIFVKEGLVVWETQATDYPSTRPDMPNHEPRGCPRGASYSWYLYSANRLKYPLVRSRLLKLWRAAKEKFSDAVSAWESIVSDPSISKQYKQQRGLGGFVRADWDEMIEIIAANNVYTIKAFGPDRISGFSPIPAMSMISYAAGTRYMSLIGGVSMSFYDWYADLPNSSPQTWGEQTDVPESADWYNSSFLIIWGSNVPMTRTPDAHFYAEVRYKGTKSVVVAPDYNEAAKFADLWLHPKQGTDAALALSMGHVILKEYHLQNKSAYFTDYCKRFTNLPFLVELDLSENQYIPGQFIRASDLSISGLENSKWVTGVFDKKRQGIAFPNGTIGSRWDKKGKWNLEMKDVRDGEKIDPLLSFVDVEDKKLAVAFPYFGTDHQEVFVCDVPVKKIGDKYVATAFDLMVANYGIGLSSSYDEDRPYTPAWQEKITGVSKEHVITVARQFAENAHKTEGRSMVILGAGINHWYHSDMVYRAIINMLTLCGCVGKSGGGWAHYVGQEKLRPQAGWLPLAFGLDWYRPPRQINSTSFFYAHTNQWRYETLKTEEILSPLANVKELKDLSLIDCNVLAQKKGWLPSAPQMQENPLHADKEKVINLLQQDQLAFACEDVDHPQNFPRTMFIWRSNLLGSSGKGHEYFLKYLLGAQHSVLGEENLAEEDRPKYVKWHDQGYEGKLDLLVTLDFRMSTTALYSDIVLPTATWYEKNDLNTSDMHPFIHPLSAAVDPVWESRSDWVIFKEIAKKFSSLCEGHLSVEKDVVLQPLLHDTPAEIPSSEKTHPSVVVVERDYPKTYDRFTTMGPLLEKLGNGSKGLNWDVESEIQFLKKQNGTSDGRVKIDSDLNAISAVLTLAPETNGHVANKAWESLEKFTGRDHVHLAKGRKDEKIQFFDIQAQPRKIISSPTWSGIESEEVSYTANYVNVHELVPWRTLTGRQELYLDHSWIRAFGESFPVYKPQIDTRSLPENMKEEGTLILSFLTPHQKWGIHSTFSDNLIMLSLSRGGPHVWISEIDAEKIDLTDNDWVEVFNSNGVLTARIVVSQRIPEGVCMMYHAQEKIVNVPLSQKTGKRGGIHNSVTRITVKPTHMIGGYAHLAYAFNYCGTVGTNRDEYIALKKLNKVAWGNT